MAWAKYSFLGTLVYRIVVVDSAICQGAFVGKLQVPLRASNPSHPTQK